MLEMASSAAYACLAAALCAAAFVSLRRRWSTSPPFPPGPPTRSLLGNAADLPVDDKWVELTRLGAVYGPVIRLRLLNQSLVVINTLEAATELLDRRGGIYSDRPVSPMACELMGWGYLTVLLPYGDTWRAVRRISHHFLHETASLQYRDAQARTNLAFLRAILHRPQDFMKHIRNLTASSIFELAYGIELQGDDDPWVTLVNHAVEVMTTAVVFGSYAVDWLPILKYIPSWFPGASFKEIARKARLQADRVRYAPIEWVQNQMREGKARGTSLMEVLLQDGLDGRPVPEDEGSAAMSTILLGGSDTTVSVIGAFFLCMVRHPEVQKTAQEELDLVLGRGVLPTFEDREALPYVGAILLEVIRLFPVTPLGIPHRVMEDDLYAGMRIPKGATVLANVWSILRDARHYPDPERFMPERFLKNGALDLKGTVPDPRGPLFGFGRRICPGRHFADAAAWLAVATVLSCFDIAPVKDEYGNEIIPDVELRTGAVTCVGPFPCDIKPRSEEIVRMLLDAAETMSDGA